MAMTQARLNGNEKPTKEQTARIRAASERGAFPDGESPELTEEQLAILAEQARQKRAALKKPIVSLRISPDTLEKAKATGKGYTGFLSRLLDAAINDPEMVKRCL